MNRRTFFAGTAAALTTAAAASACTPSKPGPAPATPTHAPSRSPSPSRTPRPATPADWTALAGHLDGRLVRPGDGDWETARRLYNTRFDPLRPTAVAYVRHADDIRTALSHAREHAVPLAVRSGGHSYAGWSSGDGRLIVDVSGLDAVRLDGDTAVVGAGARLIDVYRTLAARGRTVPGGSCPTVGISGLTLGGGHGVTSRAYGLTCDSLTEVTLVTADGSRLTASDSENRDLFWALRGAGNAQFGVVTEFRFRTHPAPRSVTGHLTWPWERAAAVVAAWQEWGPDQPDEIWSALHLDNTGGGPGVSVTVFSLGTYGELQNAVDRLADRVGASASGVSLRRRSYQESMELYAGCSSFADDDQCGLPGATPGRSPEGALGRETYAARSDFFDRPLDEAGVDTLLARIREARGGSASIALTALGGAVNRVAPTATAFVHRDSRVLAQYLASWGPDAPGTAIRAWLTDTHRAMRPHASGAAYQNYTDPDLTDWRRAYYGDAAPRLTRLKRRLDPDRVFTYPQAL
ncbi:MULTISPECIES: FAD-binding oxidoreductase [Streptomyces]|uniref:FAD-binding oxidoreductase n=1 Tax=Streptomyces tendae TaxID=1932 RepID=A0ABX6A1F8_STRTE|nr:FAD-binding oxidoreductase [Streptomyces tendae]QER89646.1 FAD-binding oxidoreductase [Streptomyces tendae]